VAQHTPYCWLSKTEISSEIDLWTKHLENDHHLQPSSVRLHLKEVKAIYHLLKRKFKMDCDFLNDCEIIKVKQTDKRFFNTDELAMIISACKTPSDLALIYTLIDTSARIGEIGSNSDKNQDMIALRGRDIIFYKDENNTLRAQIHVTGKTNEHKYRIDPKIGQMLQSLSVEPDNFVFPDSQDQTKPSSSKALAMRVHRILLNAGLKGKRLSPHTLRHSSASLVMLMSKGNISLVDSLLGHKQGSSATKVYLHNYQETLSQAVSPLQLVKDAFAANHPKATSQPLLLDNQDKTEIVIDPSNNSALVSTTTNEPDPLIEQMFPEPPENSHIRSLLSSRDIKLLKRSFISHIQFGQITTDAAEVRNLYQRITRKIKTQGDN
jgi:integrase